MFGPTKDQWRYFYAYLIATAILSAFGIWKLIELILNHS